MILGYEQPVDIPVMSIYDKDMMKMYLGALQKDYEQGLADQKEFNKMAGDFYSPISKDNESWYNITTKPIQDYLNQNPNAIRSVEGRAAIRNFINSRPYGEMANLRQSADNAKLFVAAVNKMKQDGTYSQDLADYLHETLDGWDTYGNKKVWDKTAPTRYVGMEEALLPTVQMLQKSMRVDEEKSKKHPGFIISNVSKQQADDAINKAYGDLLKIPAMQYHLAKSGLDEAGFKNLLAEQALSQTGEKWDPDQLYMLDLKLKAEADQAAKERALKRQLAKDKDDKTKNPFEFTDKITERTFTRRNNIDPSAFIDYFSRLEQSEKDPKKKQQYKGYKDEWINYSKDPSNGLAFLKKYGYVDDKNNITQKYYDWYDKATGPFREKKVQSRAETIQNSAQYYLNNLVNVSGGVEPDVLIRHIAGTQQRQKNGYYGVQFGGGVRYSVARALDYAGGTTKSSVPKNKSIHYVFDNWLTSGKVRGNAFGTTGMVAGSLPGNVLEIAGLGVTVSEDKIKQFIDKVKSQNVYLSSGKNTKNCTDEEILSDLHLTVVNADGTETTWKDLTNKGKTTGQKARSGKESPKYVMIPTSSTTNMEGTNMSGINDDFNKVAFGGGSAYKELYESVISATKAAND